MNAKGKTILTVVISVVATFTATSIIYLSISGILVSWLNSKFAPVQSNQLIGEVHDYIKTLYYGDVTDDELYWGAAKGMAEATGDKYTNYYDPAEFQEYMEANTGAYVGIGVVFSLTTDTNEIIVVTPYEDTPGERAGILPGDILLEVDGVAYNGDTFDEAVDVIKGVDLKDEAAGSSVTLKLKREGMEPFDVTVTREQINLKTASYEMLEGDIGYIRIIGFDSDTDTEVESALQSLETQGMKKLVFDLRDNGGGDFDTACRLAGKFLDEGKTVVYTEDKHGEREYYTAAGKVTDVPMVLLVNGNSASASEVFTGAMRDHGRAEAIVGQRTFGKGITQNVYRLKNGGGISITVNKYYTPNGECIHEKGIEPTVSVELAEDLANKPSTLLTYDQDLQLQKAVELLEM